ncbi:MAG: hypothetical protein L0Z68_02790 [Gammaproteobacteria bacterium]|nr:hypothetical protein [Gammaproteobacteria bacterium]
MTAPQPFAHLAKPPKRESVLERSNNFRSNIGVSNGYSPWLNQVHHILPCALFKYARIEEAVNKDVAKATYCSDCLWITIWDINKAPNLIQLPLWGAYVKAYKALPTVRKGQPAPAIMPPAPIGAPNNLPCHDRDHLTKGGYSTEVRDWLTKNIWNALNVAQKKHKVDAKTIEGQLKAGEEEWKAELEVFRGDRFKGTIGAWVNRRNDPLWYEPFSMAAAPNPRSAP